MNDPVRQPVFVFEGFRLDAQRRVLFGVDGEPISLTPRLFDTLLYFVERAGQLLTKEQLMEALWPRVVVEEHNLNKTVSELRRLLGEKPGEHRFIVTKPGHGYRFVADVGIALKQQDSPRGETEVVADVDLRRASDARRWGAAAFGIVGVAAAIAVYGFLDDPAETPLRETPLSLEKGGQSRAVWSPDGEAVAFAVRERVDGPTRIVVRDLDSPTATPITGDRARLPVMLQWTTTGRIMFADGPSLWSVSPVAATPEIVPGVDFSAAVEAIAISRDGATLAVVRRDEQGLFGVWTTGLSDIAWTRYDVPFIDRPAGSASLAFSPDGRQLLVALRSTPPQMWVLPFPRDSARLPRRVLEALPSPDSGFSWLPDNIRIVVSAADGQTAPRLHLADTQSGALRPISRDGRDNAAPSVSPDGSRLVYLEREADFDLVSLTLDSIEPKPFIATANREEQAVWAANVPTMAYMSTRRGTYEIWLHREGQADAPLALPADFSTTHWLFAPAPSPDGARIVFQAIEKSGGASSLWMASTANGALERVTSGAEQEYAGSWSPDGAWYVFTTREPDGSYTLKKVRTTGRASPEIVLAGVAASATAPTWSPDGEWILLADRGLKLAAAEGATVRDLNVEDSPCAFSRAPQRIYCILAPQPDGGRPFVALDFEGRPVSVVGRVPFNRAPTDRSPMTLAPMSTFSMAHDGSAVTYSTAVLTQNLWLMEGLAAVDLP